MPANRLRNEKWRQSLEQVFERGGGLEISFADPKSGPDRCRANHEASSLVWRVRILELTDDEIIVEPPSALGETMTLNAGSQIVGAIAIGQNRWMFPTTVLGSKEVIDRRFGPVQAVRLGHPTEVERCRRRNFYRVSTVELVLPTVTCWPLLDVESVIVAEHANELEIKAAESMGRHQSPETFDEQLRMPEVGPSFKAQLANVGGGGIGIIVDPENAQSLARHRLFWLNIELPPEIELPLAVTARLAHTHIDSSQNTYAGFAFEFGHNRPHQKFIVDQIRKCVARRQQAQVEAMRQVG